MNISPPIYIYCLKENSHSRDDSYPGEDVSLELLSAHFGNRDGLQSRGWRRRRENPYTTTASPATTTAVRVEYRRIGGEAQGGFDGT